MTCYWTPWLTQRKTREMEILISCSLLSRLTLFWSMRSQRRKQEQYFLFLLLCSNLALLNDKNIYLFLTTIPRLFCLEWYCGVAVKPILMLSHAKSISLLLSSTSSALKISRWKFAHGKLLNYWHAQLISGESYRMYCRRNLAKRSCRSFSSRTSWTCLCRSSSSCWWILARHFS